MINLFVYFIYYLFIHLIIYIYIYILIYLFPRDARDFIVVSLYVQKYCFVNYRNSKRKNTNHNEVPRDPARPDPTGHPLSCMVRYRFCRVFPGFNHPHSFQLWGAYRSRGYFRCAFFLRHVSGVVVERTALLVRIMQGQKSWLRYTLYVSQL